MEIKEYKQAKDVKEDIKADITRHIRHCAMRHGVKQEEVVEAMREVIYFKNEDINKSAGCTAST